MITEKTDTDLFRKLDDVWYELVESASLNDERKLNSIPFKDSWTAAQVFVHITKSNNAIAQGMAMPGKPADRDPEENAGNLKKMFLDFTVKYQSPSFIIPEEGNHNKEKTIKELKASIQKLQYIRNETDLSEIINLPVFGEITKLELLHFVLYHTQRHIRQLKKILNQAGAA